MSIPKQCDVVVIGGGPSGSTAATLLAQKGIDVVLFDKQEHPRYAVGESLIPDFWKFTDLTGASAKIEAEGFIAKAGGLINWRGQPRGHDFSSFGYTRPALHVERDRFDHILLSHAKEEGVQVYENIAVTSAKLPETHGELFPVSYRNNTDKEVHKIQCRYVIDASGQNAVIGRQLGLRKMDETFRYLAIWGYFDTGRYFDKHGQSHAFDNIRQALPTTYISSLQEFGDAGWSWYITLRKAISVGLVFPLSITRSLRQEGETWEGFFERKIRDTPILCDLLADGQLAPNSVRITRDYSYRSTRVAGPGYFLIGDAAGFIDPIFSIGVVLGLYMSFIVSEMTEQALKKPERADAYQAIFTRQLEGRLEIARGLALPRYRTNGQVRDLAKEAIRLERPEVQEIMHVLTSLTDRANNFKDLLSKNGVEENQPHQIWNIDKLKI